MSENIVTEKDLTQALLSLWEDFDEKVDALREKFKECVLRDIMGLVINKRDADNEEYYFARWFNGLMSEAAGVMARTDLWLGKTQQQCLIELWETLAEEISSFVPALERGAWFAQATDNGGWVEFDPDLVQNAA